MLKIVLVILHEVQVNAMEPDTAQPSREKAQQAMLNLIYAKEQTPGNPPLRRTSNHSFVEANLVLRNAMKHGVSRWIHAFVDRH